MQMQVWFGDEADEEDELNEFRPISKQETTAVIQNRIEFNRLINRVNFYKKENRHNCFSIKRFKADVEYSLPEIKITTGYAFKSSEG
jgi:hypothetical protein